MKPDVKSRKSFYVHLRISESNLPEMILFYCRKLLVNNSFPHLM